MRCVLETALRDEEQEGWKGSEVLEHHQQAYGNERKEQGGGEQNLGPKRDDCHPLTTPCGYSTMLQIAKEKANADKKREKELAVERKKAEADLFKTALVQPKVPFGVDPKTIMCVFFKAGVCEKGKFGQVMLCYNRMDLTYVVISIIR